MSALAASPTTTASPTERDELVRGDGAPAASAPQGGGAQRAFRAALAVESKVWTLVLTPLILSPLLLSGGSSAFPAPAERTLGATIMMAIFWATEALPLAVTAMIPLVAFPALGIQPGKEVARNYLQDTNLLFLGGLMVSSAIEKAELHKRIALRVLRAVGTQPRRLYLGFMLSCGFLSMWISNTATTAMMIPIARTLIASIEQADDDVASSDEPDDAPPVASPAAASPSPSSSPSRPTPLQLYTKGLLLSIAYSSSIGGIATLTGTGPNLVLSGAVPSIFPGAPEISFTQWMVFAVPISLTLMVIVWALMCFLFASPRTKGLSDGGGEQRALPEVTPQQVQEQYEALGPMSYQEKMVLAHFVVLTLLWVLRKPLVIPGWGDLFEPGFVTDSTTVIAVTIALFVAPARAPNFGAVGGSGSDSQRPPVPRCLDWGAASSIPWGIIMLLGGGFAIANAFEASGLNSWLGDQLMVFKDLSPTFAVLVVAFVVTFTTEFTSNTATCTIAMPVLASLSQSMEINPMHLLVPGTVAASFAFMLPVATAPNAIAFAGGELEVRDMARPGLVANLCGVLVTTTFMLTWGRVVWGDVQQPDWALPTTNNATAQGC